MIYPKVLVATPTTDAKSYALARYVERLLDLDYPNYRVLLVDNSADPAYLEKLKKLNVPTIPSPYREDPRQQLALARNKIREAAIEGGYDYWLSLESDVIPPRDVITRLLSHDKPYVTTVLYNYELREDRARRFVVVRKVDGDSFLDLTDEDIAKGPLIEIGRSHLGCTLVSTELLKRIEFRTDGWQYDDYLLCDDLRALGVTLYCDTTIDLFHMSDGGTLHRRAHEFKDRADRQLESGCVLCARKKKSAPIYGQALLTSTTESSRLSLCRACFEELSGRMAE